MQTAKQHVSVLTPGGNVDPSDDGLARGRRPLVELRSDAETDEQFLRRFNQVLRAKSPKYRLPRLQGVGVDDGYTIVGLRDLDVDAHIAELRLMLRSPTGIMHDALVESHVGGETYAACMVIPYVVTPHGVHVALTRESRYTLFFNRREMRLARRQDLSGGVGKRPRKGWVNAFARASSRSAEIESIVSRKLELIPVYVPHESARLGNAVRSVTGRKLSALFSLPGVRPVQFVWLREVAENTGRSTTWVQIFALEIALDDPQEAKRLLEDRGRFGQSHMRSRFVPLSELNEFDGLDRHDLVDAHSLSGLLVFNQALKAGKLRRRRCVRQKKGELKKRESKT